MITAFLSPFILLGFCTAYWGFSPRFDNERKRAYILSVISSFFMTCVSISFVWHYLRYGIQGVFEKGQEGWMRGLAEVSVVFFGTYLFADLFVGYFKYRSQVGLLTGWIHHTVYIGLMIYLYNTRLSPIFLTAAIMEFPTFDLAISNYSQGSETTSDSSPRSFSSGSYSTSSSYSIVPGLSQGISPMDHMSLVPCLDLPSSFTSVGSMVE